MESINRDILTAIKKKQREEEIKSHGKLVSFRTTVTKDKSKYSRKQKHKNKLPL